MGKKQKRNRKEEERRIIAEMEAAMWEKKTPAEKEAEQLRTETQSQRFAAKAKKSGKEQADKTTQQLHCPRCRTLMENGKCPTCGHYIYMPMDKEKQKKIRLAVGIVCTVGFVVLFLLLQFGK